MVVLAIVPLLISEMFFLCSNGCDILSTCGTVGSIYKLKLKHGHYSHVFVDEAGHMTEPECLVPLGNVFRKICKYNPSKF